MKKFLLVLFSLALLVGCGKDNDDVLNEFQKKISNLETYHLEADMSIINNEDKYNYDVDVTYKKGDYYKVVLTNKDNNHEQVILKNEEGVYVVTL